MKELAEKYFKGDLTEAEDKALSEVLLNSDEAAQRFGELAQKAYERYGLPQPQWPGVERPALGSKVALAALLAGVLSLAGTALYVLNHRAEWADAQKPDIVIESAVPSGPAPGAAAETESSPAVKKSPVLQTQARKAPEPRVVHPAPAPQEAPVRLLPDQALEAPPQAPVQDRKTYSNIRVVVRQSETGSVKVRVLDPSGKEVRQLYEGVLEAGRWSFGWNGRLEDGQKAGPGRYRIEVESALSTQSQEIIVR